MALLRLPSEIILQIFEDVGSSHFRLNVERLTISKLWCQFALSICFQDLRISQRTLKQLFDPPYRQTSLRCAMSSMKSMSLSLVGFDRWKLPPKDSVNQDSGNKISRTRREGRRRQEDWIAEIDLHLIRLNMVLRGSPKLRSLRIHATSELHPGHLILGRRSYLIFPRIRDLITIENLTSLELDLCGTQLKQGDGFWRAQGNHICPQIAMLLKRLHRLRLRLRCICPEAIRLPQDTSNLRLEEMIINLSIYYESAIIQSVYHASRCEAYIEPFPELYADIEREMLLLIPKLASPKMVRILSRQGRDKALLAFDAMLDRTVRLSEDAEWDDEGELEGDDLSDVSSGSWPLPRAA
ncbi:hypothetical protein IQ07DRAFT_582256 [Pyrenochaeta sp. DS3sAY3a]|nr:hypothetical protein IQ07DRAFT_582256 [Pyrenochaeta sp. DS3sAY3a]